MDKLVPALKALAAINKDKKDKLSLNPIIVSIKQTMPIKKFDFDKYLRFFISSSSMVLFSNWYKPSVSKHNRKRLYFIV
jgi:hypothetical protein